MRREQEIAKIAAIAKTAKIENLLGCLNDFTCSAW